MFLENGVTPVVFMFFSGAARGVIPATPFSRAAEKQQSACWALAPYNHAAPSLTVSFIRVTCHPWLVLFAARLLFPG